MKKLIMIMMMACSLSAFANEPVEWDREVPDPQSGPQYRLFRAEGVHVCWSDKMIGNTCFVSGASYTDCNQAFYALKGWDCCRGGGQRSVNFILKKCTNF